MASASPHQLNASDFPNKERRHRASLFLQLPALAPASDTPPLGPYIWGNEAEHPLLAGVTETTFATMTADR
jgi:hypothetical protein